MKLTDIATAGLPNIRGELGLETPLQTQMRQMQQGQILGQQFRGLPAPIATLAQGIAGNIPSVVDNTRKGFMSLGVTGLETQAELFDKALSNYDGTPQGQARVVQALTNIDPNFGAVMAGRLQAENQKAKLTDLQTRKLEKELEAPEKWTPMVGFFPNGKRENIFVSPSGQIQDVEGNMLEGADRPRQFFPVSVAAANFQDAGAPDDLVADWQQKQLLDNTFIRGAMTAYRLIDEAPAAGTFTAQAAGVYDSLKENINFMKNEREFLRDFAPGKKDFDKDKVDKKLDDLGIKGAEFRALMINLAYQKAKSMQGEADRISDTDLNNALQAIGGSGISDSDSIKKILINNMMETAENYRAGYEIMFGTRTDYEPFDAMQEFGVNDFFNEIGYVPTGDEKVFSATEINNMFGEGN